MNKKNRQIAHETIARWKETIMRPGRGDIDAAKKLIHSIDSQARIYVVDTPVQFYIAQAVIRRRITKKYAKETVCPKLGIKADFIDELQGRGGVNEFLSGRAWSRTGSHNLADRTWKNYMEAVWREEVKRNKTVAEERRTVFGVSRWSRRQGDTDLHNLLAYQTCDIHGLYHQFFSQISANITGTPEVNSEVRSIMMWLGFDANMIQNSCLTLGNAVSNNAADIVLDNYDYHAHGFDATQSEIMTKTLNCKDPQVIFFHEIFHLVPAIMRFKNAFLLLSEKPKIAVNADGQLHSETGPAVEYSDGIGFWFVDGHILRQQGPKIVLWPEKLTGKEIEAINNEEERRIAIDRLGWEKYLVEVGAEVIDTRENWVDNTTEVLFKMPEREGRRGGEEPLRALLACRSTGRRYFLAVPQTTSRSRWRHDGTMKNIRTCEDVQKWMSNGATTTHLPYAKHEICVIGAS